MAVRKISFSEGEFYHLYNRGNSKQAIFLDAHDYQRFAQCLYLCNSEKNINFRDDIVLAKIDAFDFERGNHLVDIAAWVLMPNHFHIYLTISSPKSDLGKKDGKNHITEFMRKLQTSYVSYFNKKYGRTGGLFEGSFKATHVIEERLAKYLFSYIHLNPIKLIDKEWKEKGLRDEKKSLAFLSDYKWSSYFDYTGVSRAEGRIINPDAFPNYFPTKENFDTEILVWLRFDNGTNSPRSDLGELTKS